MAAQDVTIRELVDRITRGELRLPELQRRFVWQATKVRDLFDSLYRGYPSGTILTWNTDRPVETQPAAVDQDLKNATSYQLLLDGQQRLTSLSAVLRGVPIQVKDRKRPIELLFNLDHPEHVTERTELPDEDSDEEEFNLDQEDDLDDLASNETFALRTNKLASLANWIPVTEALRSTNDAEILRGVNITSIDDPKYALYSARLGRLRDIIKYTYRVDVLDRSLSYQEVTDIFVRVNSSGTTLRSSDLALAQITARWPGSLSIFTAFAESMRSNGFDLDLAIHLKALVAMATDQSRFRHIGTASTQSLMDGWDRAVQGIEFAVTFLQSNLQVESPVLLSSPFIVVALAVYGDENNYRVIPGDEDKLRTWVLSASTKGRYTRGATETMLDQDITAIRRGTGATGLLDSLGAQFGRLKVDPNELRGATSRSPLYRTMFLTFRDLKAKDWDDGVIIGINHAGAKHKIESHHIFPQQVLNDRGRPKSEIDNVANLAFISSKKNKRLGTTPPSKYLDKVDAKLLKAQCIPLDSSLWEVESYRGFLEERRAKIAKQINKFMKVED